MRSPAISTIFCPLVQFSELICLNIFRHHIASIRNIRNVIKESEPLIFCLFKRTPPFENVSLVRADISCASESDQGDNKQMGRIENIEYPLAVFSSASFAIIGRDQKYRHENTELIE